MGGTGRTHWTEERDYNIPLATPQLKNIFIHDWIFTASWANNTWTI